ncbi:hypothetical protein K7432_017622 [Basidiobolus ranarum]|uniref:Uncharacterized protein n=1 Tax=Basidiobolus ranarum TaxID=34480 RepID=A0ABR2WD73_9FUNG
MNTGEKGTKKSNEDVFSLAKSLGELAMDISGEAIQEPIEHSDERVFKLRFTRKQFEDFRDACNMIRKIGNDKDLAKILSQRLEITEKSFQSKVINPREEDYIFHQICTN